MESVIPPMKGFAMRLTLALLMMGLVGCQHTHLRYNTVRQAETLAEIYEQQVLDNLAKSVHDAHALPFFAYPKDGSSRVTDEATASASPLHDFRSAVGITGKRTNFEQWGLTPVVDPDKLQLMQCAYQRAVYGKTLSPCADCYNKEKAYPTTCEICCGWIKYGSRCEVPHDCCELVGHHCGTYVWVPRCHRDKLSLLTLRILDFAVNEPEASATPKKTVTIFIDKFGRQTERGDRQVGSVTAEIKAGDLASSIAVEDKRALLQANQAEIDQALQDAGVSDAEGRRKTLAEILSARFYTPDLGKGLKTTGMTDKQKADIDRAILDGMKKALHIDYTPTDPSPITIPKTRSYRPGDGLFNPYQLQRELDALDD